MMKKRRFWVFAWAILFCLPVMAAAPEALSVLINGQVMEGKALWYKGRIYVPLEDVARSTGGTYHFNKTTGKAQITVGPGRAESAQAPQGERPNLRVEWEKKYVSQDNARVLATVMNTGPRPAVDVEAICIFKDGTLQEVSASAQALGTLTPGQRRTVEFRLFEAPTYQQTAWGPTAYWGSPVARNGEVLLNGQWTRVSYELKFNYN